MVIDPDLRASRINRVFERNGRPGRFTQRFDDLPEATRCELQNEVQLRPNEAAILTVYVSRELWALITTDRVIWKKDGAVVNVEWGEIQDATLPASVKDGITTARKRENDQLEIVTKSGESYLMTLESGPPLSGIWNVLKTIAAGN